MSTKNIYRHGDVLIIRIDKMPEGVKPVPDDNGRTILAYGEVTGHAHAIDATVSKLFEDSGVQDKFLQVTAPVALLTHEEHDAIELPCGDYIVRQQRSLDPMALKARTVAD